jgi:superfamily II DNA or RNA helicase
MVQTVVGQLGEFEKGNCYFDLIVYDECHHAQAKTYLDIIEWNKKGKPEAALLGVTATPNRGDEVSLLTLFDNYFQITTRFLIDSHYLVRPRFVDLTPKFTVKKGKKLIEEIGKLNKNVKDDGAGRELIKSLCVKYLESKNEGKTVIFTPGHGFSKMVYECLVEMGRKPAYLYKGIDAETRAAEIKRFEEGDAEELINVDIATEGYDFPAMRNIVDFDTNGTHGQWVQKVGRVLRTAPEKTTCTVIDFGGNVQLYPQGVEFEINTEGAFQAKNGKKLSTGDFFEKEEKSTAAYAERYKLEHMPYNPPEGFETVLDKNFGVVFVSCTPKKDCIVISYEKQGYGRECAAFVGDKSKISLAHTGVFDDCVRHGEAHEQVDRPISNAQIRMLAPEYPTTAMTWNGANCAICWKTWKYEIIKILNR